MARRAPIGATTGRPFASLGWIPVLIAGCTHHPSLEAAPPTRPVSAEARSFYLRGAAALARGDRAEVLRACDWVIRLDPDPIAAVHAAELLAEVDPPDLERAEALAADAVARDPSLSAAHRALGLIRVRQGDGAGALIELDLAAPDDAVIGAAVRAEMLRDAPAEAEARWVAWQPTSPAAGLDRARMALVLGHPADARDQALGLADDAVIGADAFQVAVDAGAAACDLREVHAFGVAHAARAADQRWRDPLHTLAERTADVELGERIAAIGGPSAPPGADPDPLAVEADGLLALGRTTEVLALTEGRTDDPSVAWIRAGALAALGRVGEAIGLVRATAADRVDAAVRDATVRRLVGDDAGAREVLRSVLDAPCPVAAWVALAASDDTERCAAARYAANAAAVRVGDPTLRAAAIAPGCSPEVPR